MTDPVSKKLKESRILNEPDVLGLSPFEWIAALYPAFAWSVLAPKALETTFILTAAGTVLLAAFFYAACRNANAKERLRDLSHPNGDDLP